jgi:hypothetical protein
LGAGVAVRKYTYRRSVKPPQFGVPEIQFLVAKIALMGIKVIFVLLLTVKLL